MWKGWRELKSWAEMNVLCIVDQDHQWWYYTIRDTIRDLYVVCLRLTEALSFFISWRIHQSYLQLNNFFIRKKWYGCSVLHQLNNYQSAIYFEYFQMSNFHNKSSASVLNNYLMLHFRLTQRQANSCFRGYQILERCHAIWIGIDFFIQCYIY